MKIAYNPQTEAALKVAPSNNDITFDLPGQVIYVKGVKFDGKTYPVFKKYTSTNSGGYNGLVPAPSYNKNSKDRFLKEDGTWEVPYIPEPIISYSPTSISLTKDWKSSGFILNTNNGFTSGTYAIKIMSGNLMFSGTVSVYVGKITVEDEIVLHMSGIPQVYSDGTQGRIYAKIAPSATADYGEIYLATNVPQSAITNLSITMKKLI